MPDQNEPTSPDGGVPTTADWSGVGAAFRALGRELSGHAKDAGSAISAAREGADSTADQVSSAFKTAVDHLDSASTDPAVGRATRTATAKLLDAIKAELTGEPRSPKPPADPAAIDPGSS